MEGRFGWLYDAETVAKIQLFFGLECIHEVKESNRTVSKTTDNGACGDCLSNSVEINSNGVNKRQSNSKQRNGFNTITSGDLDEADHLRQLGASRKRRLGDPNASLDDPVSYRVHNYFWYYLFAFGASLGDDIFYFTFYPFWFFNISSWVIRRVILMWGLLMYVGQSSKEFLKLPRPSAPPVAPLEKRYFQEYGMPSTHAMVGTIIPFTLLFVTWDIIEYPHAVGVFLASAYTLLVCMSRLYKGMHYILDLIVGIIITFAMMYIVFQFMEIMDTFLITHPYAPAVSITLSLSLGYLYPTQNGRSSTRADTMVIMGAATGVYSCLWLAHQTGVGIPYDELPPPQIKWPDLYGVGIMMAREFLGVSAMAVIYLVCKTIVIAVLAAIGGQKITQETKKETWVEIPYKYITYFFVSTGANYLAPILFDKFGL